MLPAIFIRSRFGAVVQLQGDGIKQIALALVTRTHHFFDRHARTGETLIGLVERALSDVVAFGRRQPRRAANPG